MDTIVNNVTMNMGKQKKKRSGDWERRRKPDSSGPRGQVRLMPSRACKSPGDVVQQVWVRAYASAFLTSSQLMLRGHGQTLSTQTVDLIKDLHLTLRADLHRQTSTHSRLGRPMRMV